MDNFLIGVAVLAVISFLVVSVLAGIETANRHRSAIERCRYRSKKQLMSGAERHCFQLLNDIFSQRFYIIPDVNLSALLSHKVGRQNRQEAFELINHKTVDFVFCNKRTLRPVCAVKLDDGTKSSTSDLGSNPKDMEKIFRSAHLPFVRITNPKKLDRQTIIEEFSRVIYETSILSSKKPSKPAPIHLPEPDDPDDEEFDDEDE